MRILVWGLGYVGTVSAACLASAGHEVVGVDVNEEKVRAIQERRSPVREPGLTDLVASAVASGALRSMKSGEALVGWAQISIIAVAASESGDSSDRLRHVLQVAQQIGQGLTDERHVVVLRTTVPVGTTRGSFTDAIEKASGRRAGRDFGVVFCPESLREGSAVEDFRRAAYLLLGGCDEDSLCLVEKLFAPFADSARRTTAEEAEISKLAHNAFHALKVGFANEIDRICRGLGIDGKRVMRSIAQERRLNLSEAYLEPGLPFGGSCLGKDLRLLVGEGQRACATTPILSSILESNGTHLDDFRFRVRGLGVGVVGFLGLAFKPGTDDVRESPALGLILALRRDGLTVKIYDPDVLPNEMTGANRLYLERYLPDFERLLCGRLEELLDQCDAVVVTQRRPEFWRALAAAQFAKPVLGADGATGRTMAESAESFEQEE